MSTAKKGAKPAPQHTTRKSAAKSTGTRSAAAKKPAQATGQVLTELKSLAKELNKAAKGLGKKATGNPKEVSAILGSVERMTADAANKSLLEAESAKQLVVAARDTLGKDWNRKELDEALHAISGHLTNIIVAQEFQDLAGQALRKAMKALVGAIIVVEGGGPTEEQRMSQKEVDSMLKDLMA
jgi:chemotaxis regulatin CheY-phosphate phosphatase CheZ